MEFVNFWLVVIVAIAGHFLLEFKKLETNPQKNKKEKNELEINDVGVLTNHGGLLILEEDLHKYIGIKKEDLDTIFKTGGINTTSIDILEDVSIKVNNRKYYKVTSVNEFIDNIH